MVQILKRPANRKRADGTVAPAAQPIPFSIGKQAHWVRDEISGSGLKDDITSVCGEHWWAVILRSNGEGAIMPSHLFCKPLTEDRMEWLLDVATELNTDLHHGGHWVVAWSVKSMTAFWRDHDGAMQFEFTNTDPWARVRQWGTDWFIGLCAEAWVEWRMTAKDLDVREDQQIHRKPEDRPSIFL